MHIVEKPIKESAKDLLLRLELNNQALEADLSKKNYLRNVIGKIKKDYPNYSFTTKTTDKKVYVWRSEPKPKKKKIK
jgi:predicted metal-dependent peptidase